MKYVASFYYFLIDNREYMYNGKYSQFSSLITNLYSPSSSLHIPTNNYFELTNTGVGTKRVYAMEEGESLPPVLWPSEGEIPSIWEGEVQAKLILSHLKDVGRKETEGKKVGQGTESSLPSLPSPAPPTPTPQACSHPGSLALEISRYVWRRQEYWAVGTLPGDSRGRLQHKAKTSLLPLSTLSIAGLYYSTDLTQGMGKKE